MARPLRVEQAGGGSHITTRGYERRAIFRSDRDWEHCLGLLGEMTRRFGVRLHACTPTCSRTTIITFSWNWWNPV